MQQVDIYIRIREGQNPPLIDLELVNEDGLVQNVASEPHLGSSDHVVVAFDFMCYYSREDVGKVRYQYVSGDYETMEEEMKRVNWVEQLHDKERMECTWEVIRDKIADTVERNVPKMNSNMSKKFKPTWIAYESCESKTE